MRSRVSNPNHANYKRYGGRGITCCERWKSSFAHFISDMGLKPFPDATLERKDNNGNYCPENCRWASRIDQARNRSSNRVIEFNGESKTLSMWAEQYGLDTRRLWKRLKDGWPMDLALKSPPRKLKKDDQYRIIEYLGEAKTLKEWSLQCGISITTMRQRVNRNWSPERIITTPLNT